MAEQEREEEAELLDRLVPLLGGSGAEDPLSDPPPDLFRRIDDAASVVVDSAPVVVEYSIDRDDMVVSTGGDWDAFARGNDGAELARSPARLSLWSQIQGEDARSVWQSVVSEVRRTELPASVPFRCDGPAIRRWYEIDVSPGEDGSIDFRSRLVFEEPRPEISLLARGAQRDGTADPVLVCCWCARAHDGHRWMPVDDLVFERAGLEHGPAPQISQGICHSCAASMQAEADRLAARD